MPLIALPLCVIDSANRNAGAPLPNIPIRNTVKYLSRGTSLIALGRKGTENKNVTLMRRHANSKAVKAIRPFLIRMYEVPHITVSAVSSSQFWALCGDVLFKYQLH